MSLGRIIGTIRPEDHRRLVTGFVLLAGIMTSHAILETARDTLFLTGLPASQLPWAYLGIAGFAALQLRFGMRWLRRLKDKRLALAVVLTLGAFVTSTFWIWVGGTANWARMAFYIWTGVLITVIIVQFWLLLDEHTSVTEAKRIFPTVAAGGVFGAILGSFLADVALRFVYPPDLLILAAGILALTAGATFGIAKTPVPNKPHEEGRRGSFGMRKLFGNTYLRYLLLLVLISTVALTLVDFLFKAIIVDEIPRDELGPFFARFYLALNVIALVVQLFIGGWLLRVLGVERSLSGLPGTLAIVTVALIAVPGLLPIALLKGLDGSSRHSLYKPVLELLYLPLSAKVRERSKALIDVFGHRGGQALASVLILSLTRVGANVQSIAWALLAFLFAWLIVGVGLHQRYLALFRSQLRDGSLETRVPFGELDLGSLEALLGAINSDHDREVMSSIDLFDALGRPQLIPAVILYHPSDEVKLRALDVFARSTHKEFVPVARRLLRASEECQVRAGALRAITAVEPDKHLLEDALENGTWIVQATALVGLLSGKFEDDAALHDKLNDWAQNGSEILRLHLARALQSPEAGGLRHTLPILLGNPEISVRQEALRAMLRHPDVSFTPQLVECLGVGALRPRARQALIAIGDPALNHLETCLKDASVDRRVLRHVPRTISRFAPSQAVPILLDQLEREEDGAIYYKILRGLGRIRANHPEYPFDERRLLKQVRATIHRVVTLLDRRVVCEQNEQSHRTMAGELLAATLLEKERNALERTFRLLGLAYPQENFELIWRGLRTGDKHGFSASREILEAVLPNDIKQLLLALTDDVSPAQRVESARRVLASPPKHSTLEECLLAMLEDASEAVRSIAAHQIADLGMVELIEDLRRLQLSGSSTADEPIRHALQLLEAVKTRGEVPGVA